MEEAYIARLNLFIHALTRMLAQERQTTTALLWNHAALDPGTDSDGKAGGRRGRCGRHHQPMVWEARRRRRRSYLPACLDKSQSRFQFFHAMNRRSLNHRRGAGTKGGLRSQNAAAPERETWWSTSLL